MYAEEGEAFFITLPSKSGVCSSSALWEQLDPSLLLSKRSKGGWTTPPSLGWRLDHWNQFVKSIPNVGTTVTVSRVLLEG